ncbi:glutathione S-transferase family protein [Caulobacter sp. S45]|uniref:glutathione S-transferase family protein n=1 Tax=Caulobacter sp. S45 TaxID=1641861 RepID=UPI00131C537C|nr:glutathione S-transferase family protein [Caulobacter sp. S45]
MKLYGSTRSPFVRKVVVAAHELDLFGRMSFEPVVVSSTSVSPEVAALNPLGHIPTLQLDDGTVIHDSLVICEYLDALVGGGRLFPAAGAARWDALTRHALGNGLLEALVKLFTERRRTDPLQPLYVEVIQGKFFRSLPMFDQQCRSRPEGRFDIGDIVTAGALAYADFRFPALEWRKDYPDVARFYDEVAARPSMRAVKLEGESASPLPG